MRTHRVNRRPVVRAQELERAARAQARPVARPRAESSFEVNRRRGPALSTPQEQALASFDEALRQVAQELVRLANGLAPLLKAAEAPATQPVGQGASSSVSPVGEFGPPPSGGASGFSPVAPPGVTDSRVPPPYTIAEKKAGTFPAQLAGETLAQYALRTAAQTGFNVSTLGAFVHSAGSLGAAPNASYAELVDRFQNPTAYWSQAELDRQNAMREADIALANKVYTGPVALSSLSADDKRYLQAMEEWVPQVGDVWHRLLAGSHLDIARAINDTAYNLGTAGFDFRNYHGPLRPFIEQILAEKGLKHP